MSEDVIRDLLTTPPGEFVAERNRVAKAMKASGEKDAAKAIASLRKPSVAEWVFNVLAAENPDEIEAFADAASDVQEAQAAAIEGRPAVDIRDAVRVLREHTAALVALARPLCDRPGVPAAGSSVGELTARLAEIAATRTSTELLRTGLLGGADPGDPDPFGGLEVPARPARRAKEPAAAPSGARKTRARVDKDDATPSREERARAAAEAEAEERRARVRALADAERAQTRARKQLDRAETDVERLTAAATKAQAAYDDAAKRLDTARGQLDAAEAQRDKAAKAVAAAESAVTAAQKAVDADR